MTVDYREYFKLTIDLYFDLWTRYRTLDNPIVLLPFVTGPHITVALDYITKTGGRL